jgi:hypothetical protein
MKTVIVSAFFKIPSKKSYTFYYMHLYRWFRAISSSVIFFTTHDVWQDIVSMGHDLSNVQFHFMSVDDFKAWELGKDFWNRQTERDIEKYHTVELAALWYEKKEFVKRAMNISDADLFIWCDAGCVRNDISERAMMKFGSRNAPINDDRIHIQQIAQLPYNKFYVYPATKYAGAIIAGNRTAWINFEMIYRIVMFEYDENKISCNSDQYVMASCNDRMPNFFMEHMAPVSQIDHWFFFLEVL